MPLYNVGCICGYRGEKYLADKFHFETLRFCPDCNHTLTLLPSFGTGLRWFEESRPRVIWNMADEPITVTSYAQHEQEMKKHGVALAGQRRGMPGCWA